MTNDGVKKMLRRSGGFDARRKIRIDMISKTNMKLLLALTRTGRHYKVDGCFMARLESMYGALAVFLTTVVLKRFLLSIFFTPSFFIVTP